MPDLSGLAYFLLAAYATLLLLTVVAVAAVGYVVGRWRGVRVGLLAGVVSMALIIAASIFLGVNFSLLHYVLATSAAIAVTVAVGPKT